MILYLDSSALVKRYILEIGSDLVNHWIAMAESNITNILTRLEVPSAIAKANWMGNIDNVSMKKAISVFTEEWSSFQRLPLSEMIVERAAEIAVSMKLRSYDAIHLTSALFWQETLLKPVIIATFDKTFEKTANELGLQTMK